MLVLSSRSRLLGSNPIVWLCDQEPVKSFQKGPPPEKAKLKWWRTYLRQFRLTVHHIPGIRNELSDYISRNNFDALIGESSEALAKEALVMVFVLGLILIILVEILHFDLCSSNVCKALKNNNQNLISSRQSVQTF